MTSSDPRIEGFLRAISLHTGIPYEELAELYSVRRGAILVEDNSGESTTRSPVGVIT